MRKKIDFQTGCWGLRRVEWKYQDMSKMVHFICQKWCILFNGERKNVLVEESNGQSSVVTDGMKTKIEMKIQEDMHGCIQFYWNSWMRMSVGLSICKMFIFMHFHPKPCFEVVHWGTRGLLVMNICPFTIKQDALLLNWPLCSSHYH